MEKLRLSKEVIEKVFADAICQADYIVNLHRIVFTPQIWAKIKHLQGYVTCSEETWLYISCLAQKWDKENINSNENKPLPRYSAGVLPGGAWMNSGFTCGDKNSGLEMFQVLLPAAVLNDGTTMMAQP